MFARQDIEKYLILLISEISFGRLEDWDNRNNRRKFDTNIKIIRMIKAFVETSKIFVVFKEKLVIIVFDAIEDL